MHIDFLLMLEFSPWNSTISFCIWLFGTEFVGLFFGILMFSRFRKPSITSGYFKYSKHRNRDKVQKIIAYDAVSGGRRINSEHHVFFLRDRSS